jgi:hypothetical protein
LLGKTSSRSAQREGEAEKNIINAKTGIEKRI